MSFSTASDRARALFAFSWSDSFRPIGLFTENLGALALSSGPGFDSLPGETGASPLSGSACGSWVAELSRTCSSRDVELLRSFSLDAPPVFFLLKSSI